MMNGKGDLKVSCHKTHCISELQAMNIRLRCGIFRDSWFCKIESTSWVWSTWICSSDVHRNRKMWFSLHMKLKNSACLKGNICLFLTSWKCWIWSGVTVFHSFNRVYHFTKISHVEMKWHLCESKFHVWCATKTISLLLWAFKISP